MNLLFMNSMVFLVKEWNSFHLMGKYLCNLHFKIFSAMNVICACNNH